MSEMSSTLITMAGITRKSFPETPGTKNIGMNVATLVRMAKVTGLAISLAPSMAAGNLAMPPRRFS